MSNWFANQLAKTGHAPPAPAPVQPYQQPAAQRPSDALRATQGKYAQMQGQQGEGHGTYADILSSDISGYEPDPKKYGVLKDTSVSFNCPECSSPNFFSRRGALRSGGKPPAPHCFDCGYNGEAAAFQEPLSLGSGTGDVINAGLARGQSGSHIDFKNPIAHIK